VADAGALAVHALVPSGSHLGPYLATRPRVACRGTLVGRSGPTMRPGPADPGQSRKDE